MTGHMQLARGLTDEALDLAHQAGLEAWIGVGLCTKGLVLARGVSS